MILHEYQVKQLLAKYGLRIPNGIVFSTLMEVETCISKLEKSPPWVVKCQVHAGGRGKSGGIKIVKSKKGIYNFAEQWFGKRLVTYQTDTLGQPVNKILLEEAFLNIKKELYLGAIIDRESSCIVVMASTEGGIEIEKIAIETPHLIHKVKLDSLIGPQLYQGRSLAFKLNLNNKQVIQFTNFFMGLSKLFLESDLTLLEINPLVITDDDNFICLDGKLIVDENAIFRQADLFKMRDYTQENELEAYATQWNLNYISLNGNIGCMVNGAGLAMGTMDILKKYGGEAANFLDISGGVTEESVIEAFKIILLNKKIKTVLVNIFGGIVCCDLVAKGIVIAINKLCISIPIVVLLKGNNSQLGIKRLTNSKLNIVLAINLIEAVKEVIYIVKGT